MRPYAALPLALVALLLSVPIPAVAQPSTPAAESPVAANGNFAGLVDIGGEWQLRDGS